MNSNRLYERLRFLPRDTAGGAFDAVDAIAARDAAEGEDADEPSAVPDDDELPCDAGTDPNDLRGVADDDDDEDDDEEDEDEDDDDERAFRADGFDGARPARPICVCRRKRLMARRVAKSSTPLSLADASAESTSICCGASESLYSL
jgi:hypothetical protein